MLDKIRQFGSQGGAVAKMAILQRRIMKKKIVIEDRGIRAVVMGSGKLKEVEIDGESRDDVVRVVNEAIDKAQKYAAGEMQGSMGDLSKLFGG